MSVPDSFPAFVAEQDGDDVTRGVRDVAAADLPDGDVTIRVTHSSVNYKDALATIPKGGVAGISPLIPGVDLVGEDVDSGATVLVTGRGLGVVPSRRVGAVRARAARLGARAARRPRAARGDGARHGRPHGGPVAAARSRRAG